MKIKTITTTQYKSCNIGLDNITLSQEEKDGLLIEVRINKEFFGFITMGEIYLFIKDKHKLREQIKRENKLKEIDA